MLVLTVSISRLCTSPGRVVSRERVYLLSTEQLKGKRLNVRTRGSLGKCITPRTVDIRQDHLVTVLLQTGNVARVD